VLRPAEEEAGREWNLDDLFGKGQFWPNVDWAKTSAYSLGLGQIYVNLIGRELKGAVRPGEEYGQVKRRIQEKLRVLRDPDTDESVVVDVYDRDDIYHGPFFENAPDLVVGFEPGYRVSWQTCLGGMPPGNVVDNPEKWSGDHCSVDPHRIPGILFVNRVLEREEPSIFDIAPTVLDLFGVALPSEMDGRPLGLGGVASARADHATYRGSTTS
jgi:predicted AlkP superfamily phosphohydrolase/phosphomutase